MNLENTRYISYVFMYCILTATKSFSSGFIVADWFNAGFSEHFVKFSERFWSWLKKGNSQLKYLKTQT